MLGGSVSNNRIVFRIEIRHRSTAYERTSRRKTPGEFAALQSAPESNSRVPDSAIDFWEYQFWELNAKTLSSRVARERKIEDRVARAVLRKMSIGGQNYERSIIPSAQKLRSFRE